MIHKYLAVMLVVATAACAGAKPKDENEFMTPTVQKGNESGGSEETAPKEEGSGLNEDQKKQMEIALRRGGEKAGNCGDVGKDVPRGKGDVEVTFDGQKGRITEVSVATPWSGTDAESCIKRAFIGEIVLPFDGDPKVVPYTVEIVDKKPAAGATDKKPGATDKKTGTTPPPAKDTPKK